jgi:hypothetical protein
VRRSRRFRDATSAVPVSSRHREPRGALAVNADRCNGRSSCQLPSPNPRQPRPRVGLFWRAHVQGRVTREETIRRGCWGVGERLRKAPGSPGKCPGAISLSNDRYAAWAANRKAPRTASAPRAAPGEPDRIAPEFLPTRPRDYAFTITRSWCQYVVGYLNVHLVDKRGSLRTILSCICSTGSRAHLLMSESRSYSTRRTLSRANYGTGQVLQRTKQSFAVALLTHG